MGQTLHLGRLIDHVHLVVRDHDKSKAFYEAVLGALGLELTMEGEDYFNIDELFVSTAKSEAAAGKLTGRVHLAFQAASRQAVQRFYEAGLEAGGTDNGEPGERPYHPGYFAAFLLDPDGNNIEAVYHGKHERSAKSITREF